MIIKMATVNDSFKKFQVKLDFFTVVTASKHWSSEY